MRHHPHRVHILLTAMFLLTCVLTTNAQTISTTDVPRTISYQGLLSSTDGTPFLDGEYQVTVNLYADAQGSRKIWQDSYTTQVTGGVFNLYLGGAKPLPDLSSMNMPLWVGTSVNGAAEMRPLTPLSASPYALNVADKAITSNKIADGAITAVKVDMDYISEVQIEGEKISAKGTVLNLVGTPSVPLTYDEATQSVMIGELPAETSDDEKGAEVLALQRDLWSANGDGYRVPATGALYTPVAGDWLGTSAASGVAFHLRTRGTPIMRYHTPAAGSDPNVEGGQGGAVNTASVGSTISGGGTNTIRGDYDAIGGGDGNNVIAGDYNRIGGGQDNNVATGGAAVNWATIGGGQENVADGDWATVSGGWRNEAYSPTATIGGGQDNLITANTFLATIGGGGQNQVTAAEATISGGHRNQVHAYVSVVGGGHNNYIWRNSPYSNIAGGILNQIGDASGVPAVTQSAITGGEGNHIGVAGGSDITHSFIGGGQNNEETASHTTIGGGNTNQIHSFAGTIGGGEDNMIGDAAQWAFVGGGQNNNVNADHGTISGGQNNMVTAIHATIGGGWDNNASGTQATIGGGQNNRVTAQWGTIAGGANNQVTAAMATVGGGENNQVTQPEATIAGGHRNQVHAYVSVVGGGHDNRIWRNSTFSGISSGVLNAIGNSLTSPAVTQSIIGGGESNAIGSTSNNPVDHSFIGGGQSNVISTIGGGTISHAVISGGQGNTTESSYTTIGGGITNVIGSGARMATIGGGGQNTIRASEATIAGGHRNRVDSYVSTIAGGHDGFITANSQAGFIGSGMFNFVDAPMASIGGGQENRALGTHTTIPGGDNLEATTSYAQSAMGFFNAPRGGMALRPNAGTIAASNDPLFMVGNGDYNGGSPVRSNAFEVSYNGHSTVYGVNGSGTGNAAITGATYVDNVLYAWGDIAAGGGINSDFGVSSVTGGGGVYDITINVTDPIGNPVTLTQASITATVVDNPDGKTGCAMITTTPIGAIGANMFRIRTYTFTADGGCREADLPFMFKVSGRP